MPQGTLFLVVGPSGAGKDTLIEAACRERTDLILARRLITRPAASDEHIPISLDEFSRRKRANSFILSWDAHGHRYGVLREIEERLASGKSVILNGSRSIVDDARRLFNPIRIVHVTARLDALARRLRNRGREDPDAIDRRLGRADRAAPTGADVVTIDNSGSLDDGISQFLDAVN